MTNPILPQFKHNWGWLLGLGILFVILGMFSLVMVVSLTIISILFLGIVFFIAGIAQVFDTFHSKRWQTALGHILIASLYIIGGGLIIYDPILASTIITAFIAWILIAIGIVRLILGFKLRPVNEWIWLTIAGIIAIILGILILIQWPISALWVIGLFIAIELIVNGWSYIFMAFAIRSKM